MYKKLLALAGVAAISFAVYAVSGSDDKKSLSTAEENQSFNKTAIVELIEKSTRLTVEDIQPSLVTGFVDVFTDQGIFYASKDGEFFIAGKVYQSIAGQGLVDIAERHLDKARLDGVKTFENDMIVYQAKNEKHVINVFTDITCGYCRKLHSQMARYNELGITVRYLAYPRFGVTGKDGELTSAFKDLRSIWCSDSPETAMTTAKSGGQIPYRVCEAPIEAQLSFGQKIGVNGTPAIILENGTLIPGYKAPDALFSMLESL